MNALAEAGAALLGGTLRRADALGGGCLSQILRISLTDGREAVVKGGGSAQAEAAMLRAIAAAGAPAPTALATGDGVLVMEALDAGGGLSSAWASLGQVLAVLHSARGERYGWAEDYAFGRVAIPNGWLDGWPEFWAERRLRVHLTHLPRELARRVEALAGSLASRLPARPAPALLHGDLWGGNILSDGRRITGLIDPACYYGHAEVDLAMLTLFDHPSAAFYQAYGPLEPGQAERLPIYQLWPALVHVRLFGSGYHGMAERMLRSCGA